MELVRAASPGTEWVYSVREAAMEALNPRPELVEVKARCHRLSEEIIALIDQRLQDEAEGVKGAVLSAIHEQIAGRIAALD